MNAALAIVATDEADGTYRVICTGIDIPGVPPCGRVAISEQEYERQLSRPDSGWSCPHCGGSAEWDDSCPATNPPDADDDGKPAIGNLHKHCIAVGSRVTCDPAPTNTDEDWLVYVNAKNWNQFFEALQGSGWVLDGSVPIDAEIPASEDTHFRSIKHGERNLIVTKSKRFFRRFVAATSIAKRLNLLDKADRIALFQAVLYGNADAANAP